MMTVPEKNKVLATIQRRFESGAWDDLDVALLLRLASVAVKFPKCAAATEEEFEAVEYLRKRREDARQRFEPGRTAGE